MDHGAVAGFAVVGIGLRQLLSDAVYIAVATVLTSVSGEAFCIHGGSSYNRVVLMAGCGNSLFLGFTASALASLDTFLGAGGSLGLFPFTEGMAGSLYKGVLVDIAALAGMSGKAFLSTGGRSDNGFTGMTGSGDDLSFGLAAVTLTNLLTVLGAGGSLSLFPFAEGVTGSIHIGIYIAVTAVAGMGGEALLSAGGSCDDGFIAVAVSGDSLGLGLAAFAATLCFAFLGAGRRGCPYLPLRRDRNQGYPRYRPYL